MNIVITTYTMRRKQMVSNNDFVDIAPLKRRPIETLMSNAMKSKLI